MSRSERTAPGIDEQPTCVRFESFLSEMSIRFLSQPKDRIDQEIDRALAGLVEVLAVDRCSLALFSPGRHELRIQYSAARPGLPSEQHQDLSATLPWYAQQVREGLGVRFDSANDLPPEASAEKAWVSRVGLRSHVALPLVGPEGPLGALCVASFATEHQGSQAFLSRFERLASAFAYVLYRRRAEQRIGEAEELNLSVLRSLPSELLVLDGEGRVITLNDAARSSARRELWEVAPGTDYAAALCAATAVGFADGPRLAEGIRSVVGGRSSSFETSYVLPSSHDTHHLLLRVTPLEGRKGAVVVHTDVSEIERARAELERGLRETKRQKERLETEVVVLHREVNQADGFDAIVGRSPAVRRMLAEIEQVAPTHTPVLLLGETGTGKELVAQELHRQSRRHQRAFVTVNCAALPASLIESELFGHERGAFTGAAQRVAGRFEVADGGTLFLDEVAELSPDVQAKLLRVLQSGEFERLGSSRTIRTNVRLVAATNRDLQQGMRDGRFRPDLYYRLSVFPIVLPPLRERPQDIPQLVWHFIGRKQERLGRSVKGVPESLMSALVAHSWPGNVRELENVVERALILTEGDTLATDPPLLRELRTVTRNV